MAVGKGNPQPWGNGLAYSLWRAQHAVHRRAVEVFEDLGVTTTQMGLAVHLQELGPMSGSDLSRKFRITPQSVSTALGNLEKRGWVTRRPHPVHGRVILYDLTEAGIAGVTEGRKRMSALNERVSEFVEDPAGLVAELQRLAIALDGDPSGPLWPVGAEFAQRR